MFRAGRNRVGSTVVAMLEKPDLNDEKIIGCLQTQYGLTALLVMFLPLGADANTAVYRVFTDQATPYFVKLRRGVFDEITAIIPKLLHDQGVKQVIAPLSTLSRQLWATLNEFTLTVYPFVEGYNGFEREMSDSQWVTFGRALKSVHAALLPSALRIPSETFSPLWRERVRDFQRQVEDDTFGEPVAAKMAAFLKSKRDEINWLVGRAEQLAAIVQTQPLEFVLCHADIHVGNLLIDRDNTLYIVDWDTVILAPKERDLMFIGGGLGGGGHTPEGEETLFYQGYGQTAINPMLLAYYRCERIVQDIAAYCEQILTTEDGGDDREAGLRQLTSQFLPGAVVDLARRTEGS